MTILVRKSGWLIGLRSVRETPKAFLCLPLDSHREIRVSKDDPDQSLHENLETAKQWLNEARKVH